MVEVIEKKGCFTALTNLLNCLIVFWRSHKLFQILIGVLVVSFIAGGTFITLQEFEKRRTRVFAATSAIQVELPQGIKKENLSNLTGEQKQKLDQQIAAVVKSKIEQNKLPQESSPVPVVVLTQNDQPILPDLERREEKSKGHIENEPPPSPTPTSISVASPTTSSRGSDAIPSTPTPTIKSSLTPTPTQASPSPANWLCIDTDGGKNLYEYGVVTWRDTTWTDTCIDTGETTDFCSGSYCRVFESYCEDNLPVREIFKCHHDSCKDGACLLLTPTPTKPPSPMPTAKPTATPTPVLPVHSEGDLSFFFEGDVIQAYTNNTGRNLYQDMNNIYQTAKEIYGPPFAKISVKVKTGHDSHYNISTNEIVIGPQWFPEHLIWLILRAMHDDLIYYMPMNWEEGIQNVVEKEINYKIFAPEKQGNRRTGTPFYELSNQSPGWSGQDGEVTHVGGLNPGYSALETIAFYKIYMRNPQFFVNLNKGLYEQKIDNKLKDKVIEQARRFGPVLEGMPLEDWLPLQFILHVNAHPGNYLIPFLQKNLNSSLMEFGSVVTQIAQDGSRTKPAGVTVGLRALSTDNTVLWGKSLASGYDGWVNFGELPYFGEKFNFIRNYTGAVKFEIGATGYDLLTFCYPYLYSQPYVTDGWSSLGIFGCVLNRKTGKVTLKTDSTYEKDLDNGMFIFPESYSYKGEVELSYTEKEDATPITRKIMKDTGDYYVMFKLLGAATSQTRGVPPAPSEENCAEGWQDYQDDKHGFKLKIPPGWMLEPSIKKPETDSFTEIEIMSTTRPEARVDPGQRISSFFVIASKKDPKTDEEYGYKSLFENSSGNQVKTQIEFKGIQAEKYVDETPAFGTEHRFELYYFKNDDFYYSLNIGIFTGDLKEKNEEILNCFLESFELLGQKKAGARPLLGLIPCPDDLLSTSEQLKEQQENWWEKPDPCESRPEQRVCGYIKSVYDNGVIEVGHQDYRNLYCYCSFFDKSGHRVFRGTEMFALGYEEGACKEVR